MTYTHCVKNECTHYCGRKSSMHKAKGNPIDLSIFGNPEPLYSENDRDCAVNRYAVRLIKELRRNPILVEMLRSIPDDGILGCFCFPKNCHCCVIIDACEFLKYNNL